MKIFQAISKTQLRTNCLPIPCECSQCDNAVIMTFALFFILFYSSIFFRGYGEPILANTNRLWYLLTCQHWQILVNTGLVRKIWKEDLCVMVSGIGIESRYRTLITVFASDFTNHCYTTKLLWLYLSSFPWLVIFTKMKNISFDNYKHR